MPMSTAVPFSPSAAVSQPGLMDFGNVSFTNSIHPGATHNSPSSDPFLSITEQPKSKWRYRYRSEKGSHGPLQGRTSNADEKKFPTVKVVNLPEDLEVSVKASLWTNAKVPVLHVHKLFGPTSSEDGTCTVKVNEDGMAEFQDIHILFTAKKDVRTILSQRILKEEFKMDKKQLKKITDEKAEAMNLYSVKLRFEAIYFNRESGESVPLCMPIFSEPVSDLKSPKCGDLKICRIDRIAGSVSGGDEVFIFCTKIDKKDIQVRFFDPNTGWEDFGKFTEVDVHFQVALAFRTPPYYLQDIRNEVKVFFQLQRKNGDSSEPKEFSYVPDNHDYERISKKRKKNCVYENIDESGSDINRNLGGQGYHPVVQNQNPITEVESSNDSSQGNSNMFLEYIDEQLDLNLFPQRGWDLFQEEQFNPITGENALLSKVNVPPPPQWNIPNDYDTDQLKTDSVVSNVKQPEIGESKKLSQKDDLTVKTEEVEQVFGQMFISGYDSCSSGTDRQNTEPNVKRGQLQPRGVSNSSLKKLWYSLCVSVKKGNPFDFMRNLPQLMVFCDENQNTLLHLAVSQELHCEFIIENLLKTFEEEHFYLVNFTNKDQKTPLHLAIEAKKPSIVGLLLKYGADPTVTDKRGFSSYHLAILVKSRECLTELLQKMNYKSPPKTFYLDITDHDGLAPLHYAVRKELLECIPLLCLSGANINVISKKEGRTPLHYAALQDYKVASILLEQKNIGVDIQDYGGYTPLHLACSSDNSEVVRQLMLNGADPSLCNSESTGVTPFNFARGNHEIKKILASSSHNSKKSEPVMNSGGVTTASCGSKVLSQDDSICGSKDCDERWKLQPKYELHSSLKTEHTSAALGDSGYISGNSSILSEDLVQKLSMLLDPPSDLWKTLMLFTIMDEDFEQNILKLTSCPTKAIITAFLNSGGTTDDLIAALNAAELHEAKDIVIQNVGDCSFN